MTSSPRRYRNGYIDCSTSSAAPALDTTIAVTAALIGILGLVGSNQGRPDDDRERTVGFVSLGTGAVFAASAVSGKRRVNECRVARASQELQARPMWIAPSGVPDTEPPPVVIESREPSDPREIEIDINVRVKD